MGDDLDLGTDVLSGRGAEAEPAEPAEPAERARGTRGARKRSQTADIGLKRNVLTNVDLCRNVVGRQDVRGRQDVGVVGLSHCVQEDAEGGDRDPGAEEVLAALGTPGPRTPKANALSEESVGSGGE